MKKMGWTISDIVRWWDIHAEVFAAESALNEKIGAVKIDSRDIAENDLFVALVGERFDAHGFIADVLTKKPVACDAVTRISPVGPLADLPVLAMRHEGLSINRNTPEYGANMRGNLDRSAPAPCAYSDHSFTIP